MAEVVASEVVAVTSVAVVVSEAAVVTSVAVVASEAVVVTLVAEAASEAAVATPEAAVAASETTEAVAVGSEVTAKTEAGLTTVTGPHPATKCRGTKPIPHNIHFSRASVQLGTLFNDNRKNRKEKGK